MSATAVHPRELERALRLQGYKVKAEGDKFLVLDGWYDPTDRSEGGRWVEIEATQAAVNEFLGD